MGFYFTSIFVATVTLFLAGINCRGLENCLIFLQSLWMISRSLDCWAWFRNGYCYSSFMLVLCFYRISLLSPILGLSDPLQLQRPFQLQLKYCSLCTEVLRPTGMSCSGYTLRRSLIYIYIYIPIVSLPVTHFIREITRCSIKGILAFKDATDQQLESFLKSEPELAGPALYWILALTIIC